jgi:hypothetical protein
MTTQMGKLKKSYSERVVSLVIVELCELFFKIFLVGRASYLS